MSEIFDRIIRLIETGDVRISEHGYDELASDGLFARDVVNSVHWGRVLEEYPDFPKGPCVLVFQPDGDGNPIHVVWGIPKGKAAPAVLITAYRPDPEKWTDGFTRRKP